MFHTKQDAKDLARRTEDALLMAIAVILIHSSAAATIILGKLDLGVLLGIGPLLSPP